VATRVPILFFALKGLNPGTLDPEGSCLVIDELQYASRDQDQAKSDKQVVKTPLTLLDKNVAGKDGHENEEHEPLIRKHYPG